MLSSLLLFRDAGYWQTSMLATISVCSISYCLSLMLDISESLLVNRRVFLQSVNSMLQRSRISRSLRDPSTNFDAWSRKPGGAVNLKRFVAQPVTTTLPFNMLVIDTLVADLYSELDQGSVDAGYLWCRQQWCPESKRDLLSRVTIEVWRFGVSRSVA